MRQYSLIKIQRSLFNEKVQAHLLAPDLFHLTLWWFDSVKLCPNALVQKALSNNAVLN